MLWLSSGYPPYLGSCFACQPERGFVTLRRVKGFDGVVTPTGLTGANALAPEGTLRRSSARRVPPPRCSAPHAVRGATGRQRASEPSVTCTSAVARFEVVLMRDAARPSVEAI